MTHTEYRQLRMCLLAFPRAVDSELVRGAEIDRFSADGEDFAALQDALTLYSEHARADIDCMRYDPHRAVAEELGQ